MKLVISMLLSLMVPLHAFGANASNLPKFDTASFHRDAIASYSRFKSSHDLIEILKFGASAADAAYLGKLDKQLGGGTLPAAKVIGKSLIFVSGGTAYKFENVGGAKYRYNGKEFRLGFNGSIQKDIETIETAMGTRSTSLLNFVVPDANAAAVIPVVVAAAYTVIGLGIYGVCGTFPNGNFKHDGVCVALGMLWLPALVLGGVMYAVASIAGAKELPAKLECGTMTPKEQSFKITRTDKTFVEVTIKDGIVTSEPAAARNPELLLGMKSLTTMCPAGPALAGLNSSLAKYHASAPASSAPTGTSTKH